MSFNLLWLVQHTHLSVDGCYGHGGRRRGEGDRERERERETDRQTDRHRDREKEGEKLVCKFYKELIIHSQFVTHPLNTL